MDVGESENPPGEHTMHVSVPFSISRVSTVGSRVSIPYFIPSIADIAFFSLQSRGLSRSSCPWFMPGPSVVAGSVHVLSQVMIVCDHLITRQNYLKVIVQHTWH